MKMHRFLACVVALTAGCLIGLPQTIPGEKKKEPSPTKPAPPVIVQGELANVDLKDKIYGQSYCKTYTFKMEKGKSYQIELNSVSYRAFLRLEDSSGRQVATAIDPAGNRAAQIIYEPAKTEDFQIIATTINGGATGKFTLTVRDASGYSILNVKDKLDQKDKAYAGNKKHKLFLANLEAGKTYQIDMRSGAFDSYLYLESPAGKVLTQDDDGGGYPSARIIYKATETGKFRVIATHFGGGGALGDFHLTVRQTDGDPPAPRKDDKKDK